MPSLGVYHFQELSSHPGLLPIPDPANVNAAEILHKVFEAHPESAITFFKVSLKNFYDLRVIPFGGLITPSSIPLKLAPRVPDIQKTMTFSLGDFDNTVSVARYQATIWSFVVSASPSILTWCTGRYEITF